MNNQMNNQMSNQVIQFNQMSQAQLLQFINMVSFQALDTQLFLDSHPADEEAMRHFNYFMELRKSALEAYAKMYGPLTIDTANPSGSWEWVETPWPWEGGRL